MKKAAVVLGLVGAAAGLSVSGLVMAQADRDVLVWLGAMGAIASSIGLMGAALSMRSPRFGAFLMLVGAGGGIPMLTYMFVPAAFLLVGAVLLALLGQKEQPRS